MTEPNTATPNRKRTLGRTIGLLFIMFAAGLAVAIWALTQTDLGKQLLPPAPAPIEVDPARIAQSPGVSEPALVQSQPAPVAGDIAGRLALLEGRLAQAEARGAGSASAGSATSRILLLIAVRRALETGRPLGGLEVELNDSMGASTPHLVAAIKEAADNPVALQGLKQEFDALRPQLDGSGEKWWARISNSFSRLVTVRSANEKTSDPAVLAKEADEALHQGQIGKATEIVAQLPNKALATDWLSKARRYARGIEALDKLEDQAFTMTVQEEEASAPARVMDPPPILPGTLPESSKLEAPRTPAI
jgi:hypothetical protein